MSPFVNFAPIAVVFATTAGLLLHDMNIDKAATVAVATPAYVATAGMLEKAMNANQHTHVERAETPAAGRSFRSSLPKAQPPRADGKRFVQNKKTNSAGGSDKTPFSPSR